VDVGFHYNVHSSDAVEHDFLVLVLTPVSHFGHVCALRIEFFITCEICQLKKLLPMSGCLTLDDDRVLWK